MRALCRGLGVAPSAYYAWRAGPARPRDLADAALAGQIRQVHAASRQTYGSPRVYRVLRAAGTSCSRRRVERVMREHGIRGRQPRRFVVTTQPGGSVAAAANLLDRRFAPGQLDALVSDITALETSEGWYYLAVTLSLRTRQVLGWSMHERLHGGLGLAALRQALERGPFPRGTLHHSDRGGHYASHSFQRLLEQQGLTPSMSRAGNCWDNAVAESFFATLKRELGQRGRFPTRAAVHAVVEAYIEGFYNRQRLHSALGYTAPDTYATLAPVATATVH